MRPIDFQRIEQADTVGSHRIQGVGQYRQQATAQGGTDVRQGQVVAERRATTVAIVEADDAKAAFDQQIAELAVPARQLRAQPHDQQNCRGAGGSEGFVVKLYRVGS